MSCKKVSAFLFGCLLAWGLSTLCTQSTPAQAQPPAAGGVRIAPGQATGSSQSITSPEDVILGEVTWEQKMDAQVPLSLPFRDEQDREVRLGEYFGEKPVILTLVFYNCTMLCTEIMNATTRSVREMRFEPGREYEIVTLSIDHRETPELARDSKDMYLKEAGRVGGEKGWHFLTGSKENIKQVADAVGFGFEYDERSDSFAHGNGITILTPQGRVASYMMGIDYPARDMRFNLIKAADNKIGSPVDQFLLTCFHYNPTNGQYTLSIMKVVRLASIATVLLLAFFIISAVRMDRRKRNEAVETEAVNGEAAHGEAIKTAAKEETGAHQAA